VEAGVVKRLRESVAPLYLFLCLILGGSAQGIWENALLQLLGLAMIGWAAMTPRNEPLAPAARQLLILGIFAIAVVAFQLIPLSASLWTHLGGRGVFGSDYALLGLETPALPISLAPYKSLDCLPSLIPPLAIICAIVRLKAYRPSWLTVALIAGTIAGVMLGAMQVGGTDAESSPWYLYPETSIGYAVGFFANANHMAILLVISLPFLAALLAAGRHAKFQHLTALVAAVVGAGAVILVGILLNRSIAGYGLALPVLCASALIVIPARSRARPLLMIAAVVLLLGALGAIAASSTSPGRLGASTSVQSREVMLRTTAKAIGDFMPLGSGLGSFRQVYDLYEDPALVTDTYVVHAHNDYAELALETGVPGLIILLLFVGWWVGLVRRVWQSVEAGPFARAASIASAAILAHSVVDYPLRTAAISACFGMCLALLADRRAPPPSDPSDLRPTRHFVFR
jgi:O-antigen ligase